MTRLISREWRLSQQLEHQQLLEMFHRLQDFRAQDGHRTHSRDLTRDLFRDLWPKF